MPGTKAAAPTLFMSRPVLSLMSPETASGALRVTVPVPASNVRLFRAVALAAAFQVTLEAVSVTQFELFVLNSILTTFSVFAKVTRPLEASGVRLNVDVLGRVNTAGAASSALRSKTVPAWKVTVPEGKTLLAPIWLGALLLIVIVWVRKSITPATRV